MPKKKTPKKKAAKKSKKKAAKKSTAPRRRKTSPKDHLDRAHRSLMRAVPHVTAEDLDALKRIETALSHGASNATTRPGPAGLARRFGKHFGGGR